MLLVLAAYLPPGSRVKLLPVSVVSIKLLLLQLVYSLPQFQFHPLQQQVA